MRQAVFICFASLIVFVSCSGPAVKKDSASLPIDSLNFDTLERLDVIFPVDSVEPLGDSLFQIIRKKNLVTQNGDSINHNDMVGKVFVVDFFFTSCKTICPKMTKRLTQVQRFYKNEPRVGILSFSVDPERDDVPALKKYAGDYGVDHENWKLITGNKKIIYGLARYSFRVDANKGDGGPEDFIHSEQLTLVDQNRKIRGYYDGTDSSEVVQLINDIGVLLNEKKK